MYVSTVESVTFQLGHAGCHTLALASSTPLTPGQELPTAEARPLTLPGSMLCPPAPASDAGNGRQVPPPPAHSSTPLTPGQELPTALATPPLVFPVLTSPPSLQFPSAVALPAPSPGTDRLLTPLVWVEQPPVEEDYVVDWPEAFDSRAEGGCSPSSASLCPPGHTVYPAPSAAPMPSPALLHLPAVIACPPVSLPAVLSLAERPGPPLPSKTADGRSLPVRSFNPFEQEAPSGTWLAFAAHAAKCALALVGRPWDATKQLLMLELSTITGPLDLDAAMRSGGYVGFCIHSKRDMLVCGLDPTLSADTFCTVARTRNAQSVISDAPTIVPLVAQSARRTAKTFTIEDDYTARFGYSTMEPGALGTKAAGDTLSYAIARGGAVAQHFRNRGVGGMSLGSSRAHLREQMVKDACSSSSEMKKWVHHGRPRVTAAFRTGCKWIAAPFTLRESLPLASNKAQVCLATWETTLRGVEEHLMLSVFGGLHNVTWARILAKVFHKAEAKMGSFEVDNYRQWANAPWHQAHGIGPGDLGCPFKGCASRILPKGAAGISPSKPKHDDDNGVICPGFWTSLTEADTPTNLVFVFNGFDVTLRASACRWALFMGYVPHITQPADPSQRATSARLHHSSFTKPAAEHLAAHVLSHLPCHQGGGDWTLNQVHRLRDEAFGEESLQPILKHIQRMEGAEL